MRQDRDLLVPATKFPYILSYANDGSRLLQIGNAPVRRLLQHFSLIADSGLLYIYMHIYIYSYVYMYIYT